MIRKFVTTLGLAATLALPLSATGAAAEEKTEFSVCWSIYVGWMPWGYLSDSGIMKKWADKYAPARPGKAAPKKKKPAGGSS